VNVERSCRRREAPDDVRWGGPPPPVAPLECYRRRETAFAHRVVRSL